MESEKTRGSGASPKFREIRKSTEIKRDHILSKTSSASYNYRERTQQDNICVPKSDNPLLYVNLYFYPKNLNLEQRLAEVGAEFWLNEKYLQGLYFVISYLMYSYTFKGVNRGSYVNMGSRLLMKRMGKIPGGNYIYKDGLGLLAKLGIIRVNDSYSVGNHSKSYALTKEYCGADYLKRSFKAKRGQPTPPAQENPVASVLASNLGRLRLDEERFREVLRMPRFKRSPKRRLRAEHAAQTIRNGVFTIVSGTKQGRFFHVLNMCPREMRRAVTLDGKRLLETDIPTCQPILLLSLVDESIPRKEAEDYRNALRNDIYTELGDGRRDYHKAEFLCFALTPYVSTQTTWGEFVERNEGNVFGSNFIKRFPNIAKKILNYPGSLACYLQNVESEICVYGLLAELQRRGIFAVSIHDGFLIEPNDYEAVADLVWFEFAERFGIDVKLNRKGA